MKKIIEKIKTNKKYYYSTIVVLVLLIGATFAYVLDQLSGGALSRVFITADTTDKLEFKVDKEISINPGQFNFVEGGESLFDSAVASARLKANSTDNTAKYSYNVYFLIETNEYRYTTVDHKTEMLLQVTDPNGNQITEISGLKYDETLQGFDITEKEDLIVIAENYEISSNSSTTFTEHNWNIIVTFINLDSDQTDNEGKTLRGKVLIQQGYYQDINVIASGMPDVYGDFINLSCSGADATWNQTLGRLEITNINRRSALCNLGYTSRSEKIYLNQYIMNLENSIQGDGKLVHEVVSTPDFDNSTSLSKNEYANIKTISSNNSSSYNSISNEYQEVFDVLEFDGNEWKTKTENMVTTENNWYSFVFDIASPGYYQMCYTLSAGHTANYFWVLVNGARITINNQEIIYPKEDEISSSCINLGYVTSNSNVKIERQAYSDDNHAISSLSFSIKRTQKSTFSFDAGYRYEGTNPNNYVWFNNELWRIIGVFDENTHGVNGKKLVKIIRDESIGGLVRTTDDGSFYDSSLQKLLNEFYYNSKDGTDSGYCYGVRYNYNSTYSTAKCDYRKSGIQNQYKKMVKDTVWHLGLSSTSDSVQNSMNGNVNSYYNLERAENSTESVPSEIRGHIGLMYLSDFGYSALEEKCSREVGLRSYTTASSAESCGSKSWLGHLGFEWTINSFMFADYDIVRGQGISYGQDQNIDSGTALLVRPVLYLDESVYLIQGDGTYNTPYVIGM